VASNDASDVGREPVGHPFVVQLDWLLAQAGGKEKLAAQSGVSVRTLGNWSVGKVPEKAVTSAVRALDQWAVQTLPGYPQEAGAPRLIESCGPRGGRPASPPQTVDLDPARDPGGVSSAVVPATGSDQASSTDPATGPERPIPLATDGGAPRRTRRDRTQQVAGVVVVLLLVIAGALTLLLQNERTFDARASAPTDALPLLPVSAADPPHDELTGSIGANAFSDPRTLTDRAPMIPPNTTISVRCRFYAPSVPSVSPDGYWYLIDSGDWAGLWSPANSYMNGDVPGGPYTHNTDFAVPECR
jgi:hypothetical protein